MARSPPCCCCFSNNVRHLVLILTLFSACSLFANLILFNLTAILDPNLPEELRPVAGLTGLYEYSTWHDRKRRDVLEALNETEPFEPEVKSSNRTEGFPILPSTPSPPPTTPTTPSPPPTTRRLVFFTNSPTTSTERLEPVTRRVRATTGSPVEENDEKTTVTFKPPPTTTRNVVLEEVERTLEKLKNQDKDENNNDLEGSVGKVPENESSNLPILEADFDFTKFLKRTLVYSAPGLGCLIGLVPTVLLIRTSGVRFAFSSVLFLSSLLVFIFPFITKFGFVAILVIRILLGACFSATFPVMGNIMAQWATLREQLQFLTTFFLMFTISPICSWPFSALLHSNEVSMLVIHDIHAGVTMLFGVIFVIFHRDSPQKHPWVNGLELNRIAAGKVEALKKNRSIDTPCGTLARSISAYSIWIAAFGFFSAVTVFVFYVSSFLSCQQVFMVDYIGSYSVLPFAAIPFFFIIGGLLNKISVTSTTLLIRIFNSVSFVLSAIFIIALPILFFADKAGFAKTALILSLAPLGLAVSGFFRSTIIVGRVYSQHIVGVFSIVIGLSFTLIPLVVNSVVKENALNEWLKIYLITAGILLISTIIFALFGRGTSAGWAESSWDPLVNTKMTNLIPIDRSQDECGLYEMRLIGPQKI